MRKIVEVLVDVIVTICACAIIVSLGGAGIWGTVYLCKEVLPCLIGV